MSFRSLTWTVVVLAAVVLVGCDGKADPAGSADDGATTTAEADAALPFVSTSTTKPIDFDTAVARLEEALDDAEGDLCELVAVTAQPLTFAPETVEQAHEAIDLIVRMVTSMGEVADPADSKLYHAAAERLEDEAAAKDYSPEWLTDPDFFKALDDPEFFEASGRLQERYQSQCGTGTTVAPG